MANRSDLSTDEAANDNPDPALIHTKPDRQVFASGELPDAVIELIAKTEMDPRHRRLDNLLKDWPP